MTLNRSWLRRGFYSPSPWGSTTPDLWMETELRFQRVGVARNDGFGGFEGVGGLQTFWTVNGHVEESTDVKPDEMRTTGNLVTRTWRIIAPMPSDVALLPAANDTVVFTDELGRTVSISLNSVSTVEAGVADHLEMIAVELL